jgi:CBS domain containing-hemolysin-like protein
MSEFEVILWFFLVIVGLLIAGLGSALETGVYSLNPVRLHVMEHTGNPSAQLLARHVAAPAAIIVSMLIFHNTGVKLATHAAAVLLHARDLKDWQVIAFDVIIMMPLLFIFAETVPKNLFATYADRLMYPFARPTAVFVYACRYSGLEPLLTGVSNIFIRMLGMRESLPVFHPRHQVQTLVREGLGHGLLDNEQLALVERILTFGQQTVQNHMHPWKQVITVRDDEPADVLWKLADETSRTRFPVMDERRNVLGILDITDVLIHEPHNCPPVAQLVQPVQSLDVTMPLRQGLSTLRTSAIPMAIVTCQDQPVGILTLKDLIEPITGELAVW